MDLLAVQSNAASHVAVPVRNALLEQGPANATFALLYAAHRLLRLACAFGGYNPEEQGAGRFDRMIPFVTDMISCGLMDLKDAGVSAALSDLQVTADELITVDAYAGRTAREWQPAFEVAMSCIQGMQPMALFLRTAVTDREGFMHLAVGNGFPAVRRLDQPGTQATAILMPDGTLKETGPSLLTADNRVEPLIPWTGWAGSFELIDGTVVDSNGNVTIPLAPFVPASALGRLIAFCAREPKDASARIARTAPGQSAAEYLVISTFGKDDWRNTPGIQAIFDFVMDHGDIRLQQAVTVAAASAIGRIAESLSGDDAPGTLAEALISMQQFQEGPERAATLRRASNLYLERIGDRTAAQLCLCKAIEAAPNDLHQLDDLLELASEMPAGDVTNSDAAADMAGDLMKLADGFKGRPEAAPILKTAAALYDIAGRTDEAVRAHAAVLEADPNAAESIDKVIQSISEPVELERECVDLLKRAWDSTARGKILVALAGAMSRLGRSSEAASSIKEALALLPESIDLLQSARTYLLDAADWPSLNGVMKRLLEIAPDGQTRTEAAIDMAEIAIDRMKSPAIALASLEKVDDGSNVEIAGRLFQVHAELGMWKEAAVDLLRVASSSNSIHDWVTLARIYRDRLGNHGEAARSFRNALEHLEGQELVATALEYAELSGLKDTDGFVARTLNRAIDAADDDIVKASLFKMLGRFNPSGDTSGSDSVQHLEEALKLNPIDFECALKLAGIYLTRDQAEKALSILEAPARAAGRAGDMETEIRLREISADAAIRCFDRKGAARNLERILELQPDNIEAARKLAGVRAALGNVDGAIEILQSTAAPDGKPAVSDAPLLRELGRALGTQGRSAEALARLQEAWTLDPTPSEEVFRELAEAASAAGDKDALIDWLKRLVNIEKPSERRFTDLIRLGDALRGGGDLDGATEWYMMAAREEYSRKVALHKALDASIEARQFGRARNILMSITEEEPDDLKKSDYLLAAALIARDDLNDLNQAASILKEALARNPFNEQAAAASDGILLKLDRLDELAESLSLRARHYRVSGDSQVLVDTLRKLGDVYENGLHNSVKAAEVFRQILTVAPDDTAALKHLAYCLTRIPGSEGEALETLRRVVSGDPTSIESYRAIRDLSILTNDQDLATRACSALIVLGQGDESDFHMAARNRSATLRLKRDQIPPDAFMRYIATGLDTRTARIFAILYSPILKIVPFKTPAETGLGNVDRISMDEDGLFQNMADAVGRVFDMDLPIFWHAKGTRGLAKAPFAGRAVIVGDDLVSTRRGKDLRFALARAVVSFMPGAELCGVVDAASLRLFFLAALKMSFPDYPLPADAAGAGDFVPLLGKLLKDQEKEEIRHILVNFRKLQKPVDLPGFMRSIDNISARAGLFMAADLEVAASRTMEADMVLSDMEPEDRLVELASWCVSADFSELKKLMIQS